MVGLASTHRANLSSDRKAIHVRSVMGITLNDQPSGRRCRTPRLVRQHLLEDARWPLRPRCRPCRRSQPVRTPRSGGRARRTCPAGLQVEQPASARAWGSDRPCRTCPRSRRSATRPAAPGCRPRSPDSTSQCTVLEQERGHVGADVGRTLALRDRRRGRACPASAAASRSTSCAFLSHEATAFGSVSSSSLPKVWYSVIARSMTWLVRHWANLVGNPARLRTDVTLGYSTPSHR